MRRRSAVWAAVLACAGMGAGTSVEQSHPLQLSVELQERECVLGRACRVEVRLAATGNRPIMIPKFIQPGGNLELVTTDPSGHPFRFFTKWVRYASFKRSTFDELQPGKDLTVTLDLSEYYRFDAAGDYRVVAVWWNEISGKEHGLDAWVGTLRSEAVQVSMRGPTAEQ